jgi:HK97 family phage prohead protease
VETKDGRFQVKQLTEAGTFEGVLSIYGVLDDGGDIVERGAFAKSLVERPEIPLLWSHDNTQVIGKLALYDTATELRVKGKLILSVAKAQEVYSLLREQVVKGLSIGYRTIKSRMDGGARRLIECALYEGSLVAFPMLAGAQVTAVKSGASTNLSLQVAELSRVVRGASLELSLARAARELRGGRR